ncbi:hypothetical protein GCM10010293_40190 [Streptomyces griseoflavus]|uniref:DUF4326 domain-containing protein n=1 Tax=Streptomyces griseoflavus TaxID=35619 RepID=UPI00167C608E|nr:DUF4326 domain-containing protein [Streptomyces griseoflavus]GGV36750.1 hypothetical protein GCM10010293_40190 [Streptomyces griseoflavus]
MTTTPRRIQRRRTKGWRKPDGAVYVGRGSHYGNPYRLVRHDGGWSVRFGDDGGGVGTFPTALEARRYAAEAYRWWINQPEQAETLRAFRGLLYGRDLMCWCPMPGPGEPDHCHAAVLLDLVRRPTP